VEPEAGKRLPRGALALRDLVLVVREHQVDAARVQVDGRLAEQAQRHRGALDVPARAAGPHPEVPGRLAGLRRLPEHEVACVLLVVVVGVHAGARLDAFVVQAREAAVPREGRDLVVDGPVAAVRVAGAVQRADDAGHRAQVLFVGGPRALLHRLETEGRGVLEERGNPLVGVLAQRHARFLGAVDGAIVHVGEVHHLAHVPPHVVAQGPPQDVAADERPEVADVRPVVDRRAAGVHPDGSAVRRRELVLSAAEGVVKAHTHQSGVRRLPAPREISARTVLARARCRRRSAPSARPRRRTCARPESAAETTPASAGRTGRGRCRGCASR